MRGMISVSLFHQPLPIPNPILPIRKQKTRTSTHTQKKKETSEQKQNQTISWPTNEIANSVCSVRLTALNHIAPAIFSQYSSLFGLLCPHSKSLSPPLPKKKQKIFSFLRFRFTLIHLVPSALVTTLWTRNWKWKWNVNFFFWFQVIFFSSSNLDNSRDTFAAISPADREAGHGWKCFTILATFKWSSAITAAKTTCSSNSFDFISRQTDGKGVALDNGPVRLLWNEN